MIVVEFDFCLQMFLELQSIKHIQLKRSYEPRVDSLN